MRNCSSTPQEPTDDIHVPHLSAESATESGFVETKPMGNYDPPRAEDANLASTWHRFDLLDAWTGRAAQFLARPSRWIVGTRAGPDRPGASFLETR